LNFNVIKNVHWLANNNNAPIFIVRLQLENKLWEVYLQIEPRVCLLMCSISDTNFFLYWDSSSKIATFSQSNSWSSSNQLWLNVWLYSIEYDSCAQLFSSSYLLHIVRIVIFATNLVHHIRFLFMWKENLMYLDEFVQLNNTIKWYSNILAV